MPVEAHHMTPVVSSIVAQPLWSLTKCAAQNTNPIAEESLAAAAPFVHSENSIVEQQDQAPAQTRHLVPQPFYFGNLSQEEIRKVMNMPSINGAQL